MAKTFPIPSSPLAQRSKHPIKRVLTLSMALVYGFSFGLLGLIEPFIPFTLAQTTTDISETTTIRPSFHTLTIEKTTEAKRRQPFVPPATVETTPEPETPGDTGYYCTVKPIAKDIENPASPTPQGSEPLSPKAPDTKTNPSPTKPNAVKPSTTANTPSPTTTGRGAAPNSSKKNPQDPTQRPADPVAIEADYVRFERHFPLKVGLLDLTGYETNRVYQSDAILSPDRMTMALSEIHYLPSANQTIARVAFFDTGDPPTQEQIMPPPPESDDDTSDQADRSSNLPSAGVKPAGQNQLDRQPLTASNSTDKPNNKPSSPPAAGQPATVDLKEVDPYLYWDQYTPNKQLTTKEVVYQQGFDHTTRHQTDIIQVVDWALDGHAVLMAWRPSVHHLGIQKSIPVLFDRTTGKVSRRLILPQLVWEDYIVRFPEFNPAVLGTSPPWDVIPLGWNAAQPSSEILLRLTQYQAKSATTPTSKHPQVETTSSGFWAYNVDTHRLRFLAPMICPEQVARNGWTVSFTDPVVMQPGNAPRLDPNQPFAQSPPPKTAPMEYAHVSDLPTPEQRNTALQDAKRAKRNRFMFWKKRGERNNHQPP